MNLAKLKIKSLTFLADDHFLHLSAEDMSKEHKLSSGVTIQPQVQDGKFIAFSAHRNGKRLDTVRMTLHGSSRCFLCTFDENGEGECNEIPCMIWA